MEGVFVQGHRALCPEPVDLCKLSEYLRGSRVTHLQLQCGSVSPVGPEALMALFGEQAFPGLMCVEATCPRANSSQDPSGIRKVVWTKSSPKDSIRLFASHNPDELQRGHMRPLLAWYLPSLVSLAYIHLWPCLKFEFAACRGMLSRLAVAREDVWILNAWRVLRTERKKVLGSYRQTQPDLKRYLTPREVLAVCSEHFGNFTEWQSSIVKEVVFAVAMPAVPAKRSAGEALGSRAVSFSDTATAQLFDAGEVRRFKRRPHLVGQMNDARGPVLQRRRPVLGRAPFTGQHKLEQAAAAVRKAEDNRRWLIQARVWAVWTGEIGCWRDWTDARLKTLPSTKTRRLLLSAEKLVAEEHDPAMRCIAELFRTKDCRHFTAHEFSRVAAILYPGEDHLASLQALASGVDPKLVGEDESWRILSEGLDCISARQRLWDRELVEAALASSIPKQVRHSPLFIYQANTAAPV